MLEISASLEKKNFSGGAATGNRESEEGGGSVSVGSGEEERVGGDEGDRNWAGNRWPRQETLALLKIRSDMDDAFKESSTKAPLWEEVSRKLGELGYNRGAKKCKEKFENIYKYHRRTKEVRSSRPNGKTYRFFEQLEALDSHTPENVEASLQQTAAVGRRMEPTNVIQNAIPHSVIRNPDWNFVENSTPTTSSSSKELEGMGRKKRKLGEYFEGLMKEVMEKQENLQRKFIEALEKCEQDRMAREEAWKMQELDRIKRERELLAQERSITAAKDAAVLAFLKKFSEQSSSMQLPEEALMFAMPMEKVVDRQENGNGGDVMGTQDKQNGGDVLDKQEDNNGGNNLENQENYNYGNSIQMSSARWPKDEVDALIDLRTKLDFQYQENGPKSPLWEVISVAMKKLGYDRSAKKCKEKWENINKYFKKVKESNKKRPEDSKTCPYFHQLDALYSGRTKKGENSVNPGYELKPEELLMHMMSGQEDQQNTELVMEDGETQNINQIQGDKEDEDADADAYRVVASDPSSMANVG
ncbi:trihelix transcription factor DF1-like [Corylus avellana]|uniref:trihelix transcription factor DF1-like n=1 Tax=Corylus avellana TaxID=13451 RepID=UPI001E212E06|nr:trihelix transcription factor DF1-like [Corylus avellana]